jgi:hypothetical protein
MQAVDRPVTRCIVFRVSGKFLGLSPACVSSQLNDDGRGCDEELVERRQDAWRNGSWQSRLSCSAGPRGGSSDDRTRRQKTKRIIMDAVRRSRAASGAVNELVWTDEVGLRAEVGFRKQAGGGNNAHGHRRTAKSDRVSQSRSRLPLEVVRTIIVLSAQ